MKILLGIHNKKNTELLEKWIGSKYPVTLLNSDKELNQEFDLLIVDGPNIKTLQESIRARKNSDVPIFLPVLLITNRENVRYITNQLWITVDEIILTPIERVELAARIEILLRARRLSLETHRLSITDPLTGIYNRRYFFEISQRDIGKIKRKNSSAACLMIDIDHFKLINDTFGHPVGDKVLVDLANKIKSCIRDIDIVARYGGEEFVVFLPETDLSGAIKVAERIRREISKAPFKVNSKVEVPVSVSIGVSFLEGNNVDLTKLLYIADNALYEAKRMGRNRVVSI